MVDQRLRGRLALVVLVGLLVVVAGRLVSIQVLDTGGYAAKSAAQSTRTLTLPAQRGTVTDRNGTPLAFTVEGRALAARPALFADDAQKRLVAQTIVDDLAGTVPGVTVDSLLADLDTDRSYVYLVRGVLPAQADLVLEHMADIFDTDHINAVVAERQDIRQQPDSSATGAIVGATDYDGNGLSGVEAKFDRQLAGEDGSRQVDLDARRQVIPGTQRDEQPAVDGDSLALTIDSDLQYTVEQMVAQRVTETGAKHGCAVVLTVADAQVEAMACYEPGKTARETGNKAVTDQFEPGSVNKVVTMSAALEQGLVKPDTVLTVDGSIDMGGITVKDAWAHGPVDMTATGILAKSSNVGTLMIAQKVGPDAFVDKAKLFGQGNRTGIQVPGEYPSTLPAQANWSASTFANLPIGQGMTVNLVQLAGMYQAIANDGVRVTPTLVQSLTADGVPQPLPVGFASEVPGTRTTVMSPETAHTLRDMLTATVQDGDTNHRGTAPQAAITGYQVAGKTGTAQQVDPQTNEYSQTMVTSTFGGFVPADHPVYSIAIMLDGPNSNGPDGTSCAPLFHDIAAYAMRQADVPPSTTQAPVRDLYVG